MYGPLCQIPKALHEVFPVRERGIAANGVVQAGGPRLCLLVGECINKLIGEVGQLPRLSFVRMGLRKVCGSRGKREVTLDWLLLRGRAPPSS